MFETNNMNIFSCFCFLCFVFVMFRILYFSCFSKYFLTNTIRELFSEQILIKTFSGNVLMFFRKMMFLFYFYSSP
ncbi:unnamed protein product [Meloidogyne enterolobii]|uniref:Uncharacterized protein n=1 Tax=Meloidogyne enterolobii TaxID=390850 RepID=A0ACB0XTJ3_MELEN